MNRIAYMDRWRTGEAGTFPNDASGLDRRTPPRPTIENVIPFPGSANPPELTDEQIIAFCLRRFDELRPRDQEFMADLARITARQGYIELSTKQEAWALDIAARLTGLRNA